MKKTWILLTSIAIIFAGSQSVYASQEDVSDYFKDYEDVYVFEVGNENNKDLVLNIVDPYYIESDADMIVEKIGQLAETASYASTEDWYDYQYIMMEVWSGNYGKIYSAVLDADTFDMYQSCDWFTGEVTNFIGPDNGYEYDGYDSEEDEWSEDPEAEGSYDGLNVKYLSHEIISDDYYENLLIVYYELTNYGDTNKSFNWTFSDKCFQNGIEIDRAYSEKNQELQNRSKEIQPGTTTTVATAFELGDSWDDVILEISPYLSDVILFSLNLEL